MDWRTKILVSVNNYLKDNPQSGDDFIQAGKITQYVIDHASLSFKLRTETISRILSKENLLRDQRLKYFRNENTEELDHVTGWVIDVERLKKLAAKFSKFIEEEKPLDLPDKYGMTGADFLEATKHLCCPDDKR